jgi:hypothetical protein
MMNRDRSQGWKYAKESGHLNEKLLSESMVVLPEIDGILKKGEVIIENSYEGAKNQGKIDSVLGHKVTPKKDNSIITNIREIKISLKKSLSGQALLTRSDYFLDTLSLIHGIKVNDTVRETLKLFTGEDTDGVKEALKNSDVCEENSKCSVTQRNRRLNGDALYKYNEKNTSELISFITNNIKQITKTVLSTGSVMDKDQHADYILYKNLVEPTKSGNKIFKIDDIVKNCDKGEISFGLKNGGTSIQIPFGHIQMHKNMLQIHHNCNKINDLING